MPPILIDNRDLIKLGFISVLTIVLAFAGGYLFGLQQASMNPEYQVSGDYQPLSSPVKATGLDEPVNQGSPEISGSTKKNNVDKKVDVTAKADSAQIEPVKKPIKQPVKKSPAINPKVKSARMAAVESAPKAATKKVIAKKTTTKKAAVTKKTVTEKKKSPTNVVTQNASDDSNKIKFSIQVAVYGGLENAESMMKKLQAKNIDAYVTDYISKTNKKRFNVRFGYFADKKTALKALEHYRVTEKGDGYLVNYSAVNIVSLAKTEPEDKKPENRKPKNRKPENRKQVLRVETGKKPASIESAGGGSLQKTAPADIVAGDVAQVESIKVSDDLKKAQDTIPAY